MRRVAELVVKIPGGKGQNPIDDHRNVGQNTLKSTSFFKPKKVPRSQTLLKQLTKWVFCKQNFPINTILRCSKIFSNVSLEAQKISTKITFSTHQNTKISPG